ncbi:MAG: class I SAM-dependent methyltransferase, partial [Sporichthyaceae bacterium]|nr:class I SAM-dependent methyltransferase [Sporichthyaceae bacterium]
MLSLLAEPEPDESPCPWPQSVHVAEACAALLLSHRLGTLLDAGGGAGYLTSYLLRSRVVDAATVLDCNESVLAQVTPPIQTRHGRLEELDAADGQYSTILLRQVLHYVDSPEQALRRVRQCLLPDGVIYVGQIVAPDTSSASWLAASANWVSPTRRRVWTVNQMLTTFTAADLCLAQATVLSHWQPLADRVRRNGVPHSVATQHCLPLHEHRGTTWCRA